MLLVKYRKKYYILRGFSTSLMLCNTLEKLNNGKFRQRAAALPLLQARISKTFDGGGLCICAEWANYQVLF